MKRTESRKSHSLWWDSHISPKNSKWLAENLEEMEQSVTRMLKLIEKEGDSFAKKGEMYYQKRPELKSHVEELYSMYRSIISHVEELHCMYRSLAGRYDHLTGELRKNIFCKESDESSSDSESDSGSESEKLRMADEENSEALSKVVENGKYKELHGRISWYDEELRVANERIRLSEEEVSKLKLEIANTESAEDKIDVVEKLEASEEEIVRLKLEESEKNESSEATHDLQVQLASNPEDTRNDVLDRDRRIEALEEELIVRNEKLQLSEEEIARLKLELEKKNKASIVSTFDLESAQKDIMAWEAECESEKRRVSELQEQILRLEFDLSNRDHEIKELKIAITAWESKSRSLEAEIKRVEIAMRSEMEILKAGIVERSNCMEELNKSLDAFKLQYNMLVVERDGLNAEMLRLVAEVGSRDDWLGQMDQHMHQLHMEHVELILGSERTRKLLEELGSRVKELVEEVERQRGVIFEGAEKKREAIRQLCFSLEHYRNGYHQLRQTFLMRKRPAVLVS